MKLSTIIPVYNAEKYLNRCLDSILSQGIDAQEIICVDDGSTDHSLAVLRNYEKTYQNIHVLTQKNSYAGVARNNGLEIAKGEYIHFMDADDYVLPGAYARVYETAKIHSADYVKTRSKTFDMQSGDLIDRNYFSMSSFPESIYGKIGSLYDFQDVLLKTARAPWTSFVKRSYLMKHNIRFNSLKCVNDRSFYMDVVLHTNKIVICNCYMVCYQINNKKSLMGIRDENFMCLIKSYDIIRDIVSDTSRELKEKILSYEFNSLAGRYAKLTIVQRSAVETILKPFLENFNWNELAWNLLTFSALNPIYELLNIKFPTEYQIKDFTTLANLYTNSHKIILYGAGQVCLALIQYLSKQDYNLDKVLCITVANTANNPDHLMGIPVYSMEECNLDSANDIIIATLENAQLPIYHRLSLSTSGHIWSVTDDLYASLKQEN